MKNPVYITLFCLFLASCGAPSDQANSDVDTFEAEVIEEFVKEAPEWTKNATMYEVNIRQYTPEGTFRAFMEHMPRLEEMGIDILWLMPIHPIGVENRKGGLGSYYSVQDYKGINPEFGTLEDFKALVADAHSRDMKVIIDWVANHTAWDAVWVQEGNMDWYTLDSAGSLQPPLGTDWSDVVDLNYDNQDMRLAMIDAMKYWLVEADIDGFRCDVAEWVPDDFWNQARPVLQEAEPELFMLAEAEHVEHHDIAFDMSYAWEWHFVMNDLAQGKKNAKDVVDYLEKEQRFPSSAYRLNMTSNHDENTWKGTVRERLGDGIQTTAVLSATLFGMPLVYSGQEAGLDHRLAFFEKDEIDWSEKPLQGFYTRLMEINHNNRALWNGDYGAAPEIISSTNDSKVLAYKREKDGDQVVVLLNMSDQDRKVKLNAPGLEGFFEELFTGEEVELMDGYTETLGPWYYKVYHVESKGS